MGHVRLAVDGTGRLAVVLLTQAGGSAAVQLAITLVDVAGGGKAGGGGAAGVSPLSDQTEMVVGSEAAVEPELLRRGLQPLQQAPSEAQLRAAVPAVLWNGEAVSASHHQRFAAAAGMATVPGPARCRRCCCQQCYCAAAAPACISCR